MAKHQSVYFQVKSRSDFETVRTQLRALTYVRDGASGTTEDPEAFWFEMEFAMPQVVKGLREPLQTAVPDGLIQRIIPCPKGNGRSLSRQLDLFGGTAC